MALTPQQHHELMAHLQRALASTSDFVQNAAPRDANFDRQKWFGADTEELRRIREAFGVEDRTTLPDPEAAYIAVRIADRLIAATSSINEGMRPEFCRKRIAEAIRYWAEGIELG